MKYIDISSYKAINMDFHRVQTPFKGKHFAIHNPVFGRDVAILYKTGVLFICPYFLHDFASGPTKDGKTNRIPAVEHDALFRMLRLGADHFTWKQADRFFYEQLLRYGMKPWRAKMWLWGRSIPFFARGKQAKRAPEPAHILKEIK